VNRIPDTLAAARTWRDAGCAVIPIRADGSKAPLVAWKPYQHSRPDRIQVENWFAGGPPGIGVICGAASENLEMLELEGRAVAEGLGQALIELLDVAGLAGLWDRITAGGYWERTPSGGVHLLYRVDGVPVDGNLKLARRPATEEELLQDPRHKVKILAETRGEGGYTIVAPSFGTVHETRRPWIALGDSVPARIPTISGDERRALLNTVRTLDEMPPAPPPATRRTATAQGMTPGDDFLCLPGGRLSTRLAALGTGAGRERRPASRQPRAGQTIEIDCLFSAAARNWNPKFR
jgi:putative DNA primase/helicase